MRRFEVVSGVLLALWGGATAPAVADAWPAPSAQLAAMQAPAGSALARLILAHQDFSRLRPEEKTDRLAIPLWLRVAWLEAHPEARPSADDPTGGYPLVLREVAEWMQHHPDLMPGPRAADIPEPALAAVGTNVQISGAGLPARSESDIRINFRNPQQIIAASNDIGGSGRQAQYYSSTGGATWGQTSLPLAGSDAFHSDPTVDWTADGTAFATTIGITNTNQLRLRAYRSTNGGKTWALDGTISGTQTAADKQLMWVDHSATSPFKDNIYVIWHGGNPAFVNRRSGGKWKTPLQVSGAESLGSTIGGDVKTNSSGHVFAFWPTTSGRRLFVAKSTTGGAGFGTPVAVASTFDAFDIGIPAMANRRALIYVSGGAFKATGKDLVYAAWTDLAGGAACSSASQEPGTNAASACKTRVWFARSTNGGATWSAPVKVGNRAGKTDQFNQALAVDETSGRLAIVYYDTYGDATRRTTHVWYQSSANDGVTWSKPLRVTTARTDESVIGADLGNQYGDYNSLSGFMGKFFPSWTDRRAGGAEGIWTAPIVDP
jgi:hypothetical protein